MTIALSSHAVIVARALAATPTVFTDIAELDTVTLPTLFRNVFDASVQNRNIDSNVLGMLRRKPLPLTLNFLPSDPTHDHLTGLYKALITEPVPVDGFKFYQTSSSVLWVASGQVASIDPKTPTDGKWAADVSIQLSGIMSIGGVTVGL
jgi:hypothetical protein